MGLQTASKPISWTRIELKERFKMFIPQRVWAQMMFLCSEECELEWSGVLYYTPEGDVSNLPEFTVTANDIFLKDIGTSGFTSYEMDGDDCAFRMANPHLEDCMLGKIHSHNKMKVFHSGTDWEDLQDNSEASNYYLSFIVNNRGHVEVKIAWCAIDKKISTSTFYLKDNDGNLIPKVVTEEIEEKILVTADGDIWIEGTEVDQWFEERYCTVKNAKAEAARLAALAKANTLANATPPKGVVQQHPYNKSVVLPAQKPAVHNFLAYFISIKNKTLGLEDAMNKIANLKKSDFKVWGENIEIVEYWNECFKTYFGAGGFNEEETVLKECVRLISPYALSHAEVYEKLSKLFACYLNPDLEDYNYYGEHATDEMLSAEEMRMLNIAMRT